MCIGSRSHAFVTVLFTPQAMQTYQCIFEATLDGLPRYQLAPLPWLCNKVVLLPGWSQPALLFLSAAATWPGAEVWCLISLVRGPSLE